MAELVGHAPCPDCGVNSEVRENKRKKLLLDCPVHSIYPYQSKEAQILLKKKTAFIAEQAAPAVGSAETVPKVPTPEPAPENNPEPTPEPIPVSRKEPAKRWSLWR